MGNIRKAKFEHNLLRPTNTQTTNSKPPSNRGEVVIFNCLLQSIHTRLVPIMLAQF